MYLKQCSTKDLPLNVKIKKFVPKDHKFYTAATEIYTTTKNLLHVRGTNLYNNLTPPLLKNLIKKSQSRPTRNHLNLTC